MPLELSLIKRMNERSIILASASPRRKEILREMGIKFKIITTLKPDENNPAAYKTQADYVADTAYMKAKEVFERCETDPDLPNADIVIGVDTVVVKDENILEKPRDREHALYMLNQLNGSTHYVLTSVQIFYKQNDGKVKKVGFVEKTNVTFAELDDETLDAYIDSGEPFDKAGGYGIQGEMSLFIESIQGDYWNVVGLPKARLLQELRKIAPVCL